MHAGHDDYHAIDDTGFFQLFAKDVQEAADLTLIAHRIAELSLNPGLCAQDGFLTSHVIETAMLPERDLIKEFLGDPADVIETPTPSQCLVFGERRRRIPEMFDLDYPAMLGVVQNQDSFQQGVAAQRPFYFDHVAELTDRAFAEYAALTGRQYARATGYRLADAEYVIAGQGSVVANAEAVADYLRATKQLKVGVLNLTMFRPFPADLVTTLLAGKKAVAVLERTDQPMAVDLPLLREIRAAMAKAVDVATLASGAVPHFYSGCFGLGSRDLQPSDLIAAVENMLPGGSGRRLFYLGVDFIRPATRLPKQQIWQEQVLEAYPSIGELTLPPADNVNLLPEGSLAFRIHSVGGWGAITMGKNVATTAFELFGLHVKANPKYGSEKKGQPTTFYGILSSETVRLNCELKHVDIVLSPDANVFRHSNPLAGLAAGGVFVIQSDREPKALWDSLPGAARRTILEKKLRVFGLDAFGIASAEATDPELRYRMQGNAFMGAFFALSPLLERHHLSHDALFDAIRAQLTKKFKRLGDQAIDDNLRVIRRGFTELTALDTTGFTVGDEVGRELPSMPDAMNVPADDSGVAQPGRFWEQVCFSCKQGQDGLADPFAATSAMPAVSSAIRDMTDVRFEVPKFVPENCTGCSQCWTQCPDSAIPGLVNSVEEIVDTAVAAANASRVKPLAKQIARECRAILARGPMANFGDVLASAGAAVVAKQSWGAERKAEFETEFARVGAAVAGFPLAKTRGFYDAVEARENGSGGLLSITVNPDTCKGCNLCVEVCPDGALISVKQTDLLVDDMRRQWAFWKRLPDTNDRYINVANLEEGIGTLSSVLLKKQTYLSMVGGDGACMGCGEKTVAHLVTSTIHAVMQPRAAKLVKKLDTLIAGLDGKGRELLAAGVSLDAAAQARDGHVDVEVSESNRARLARISTLLNQLADLKWRYTEGPGGRGRAAMGMANSTGCSSVWASTYPFNPYPFPWVNHLFQDSPSIAIGVFEGHMRKMTDNFVTIRRAELELAGEYDPAVHDKAFATFNWKEFTDEEFDLCPPIVSMGGDGAMLDIGFQNLSRLLASGKPVRVVVLDTQVYSNTGGQACTSGFTGQVADMSAYGQAQHGKQEMRKELGLLALAHRGAFVHQSSQASPSHLVAGVIKGLKTRRPAVFNLYTPCPIEHGLADNSSRQAARLALESRAFPYFTYNPDAGATFAECLDLEANPAFDDLWPLYTLTFKDGDSTKEMELPLTTADWAATEGRFKKHFADVPHEKWNDDMVPFHLFLQLDVAERDGKTPFIHVLNGASLGRQSVSKEIVALAEERLLFWSQLRQLAGIEVSSVVRDRIASALEQEFSARAAALTADYEHKIADLKATYAQTVARRIAEGLMRVAEGKTEPLPMAQDSSTTAASAKLASPAPATPAAPEPTPAATATAEEHHDTVEPYIDSEMCTSCDECIGVSNKLFAYNADKQSYVKDPKGGSYSQLVKAAELCPVSAIHPGTPLNPSEKDLEKWVKRAERFN